MYFCKHACCISATAVVLSIRNRRGISWTRGRRHSPKCNVSFKDGCLGDLADASKTTRIFFVFPIRF